MRSRAQAPKWNLSSFTLKYHKTFQGGLTTSQLRSGFFSLKTNEFHEKGWKGKCCGKFTQAERLEEQYILQIARNHSNLIRDVWFKLRYASKRSNDFTVFPSDFVLGCDRARGEETFPALLSYFDLFPSRDHFGMCFVCSKGRRGLEEQKKSLTSCACY